MLRSLIFGALVLVGLSGVGSIAWGSSSQPEVSLLIGSVRPNLAHDARSRRAQLEQEYLHQLGLLEEAPAFLDTPVLRGLLSGRYNLERATLEWLIERLEVREENLEARALPILEESFLEKFGSDFETEVVSSASYLDVFKALRNNDLRALFYVSHAGTYDVSPGVVPSTIVDSYGDNVQDLFKLLPDNLYWLGLVGCRAEPIFQRFSSRGYLSTQNPRFVSTSLVRMNPLNLVFGPLHRSLEGFKGVVIDSSERNVDAVGGLRKSMEGAYWPLKNLAEKPQGECSLGPLLHLEIQRVSESADKTLAPVSVGLGEYPMTVLDRGASQTYYPLFFPWSEVAELSDISIVVQGREGFQPGLEEELGRLEIWSPRLGLTWRRVEIGGRPLGQTGHVYQLDAPSKERWRNQDLRGGAVYWTRSCHTEEALTLGSGGR